MIDKEALYKAREETKEEILKKLKTCDRFGVVRPQGFGKSYIITELCKELNGKKLIIEPTEGINEYLKKFGVCKNTSCIIYNKLLHEDFDPKILLDYDYIFLDEMHRALAPKWGKVLNRELSNFKGKVIGFSATPIRGDARNSIDELFNGEQISTLDLVDAIMNSMLPQPTYVTGIYEIREEDENKIIKDKELARQIYKYDLQNNLEFIFKKYLNIYDNKCLHIIVFCHKISFIPEAEKLMSEWLNVTTIKNYTVHSLQKEEENRYQLQEFENSTEGINIIYSANMLNEGIHPKNLDAVVFLRNTRSNIVYYQQLGRIISEFLDNPVVFDLVNNIYNIENGYYSRLKEYAYKNGIRFNQLQTKLGEPLKIYEEQKDLIALLRRSRTRTFKYSEQEFILNNYKTMTLYSLSKLLNVKPYTIKNFLKSLHIKYDFTENVPKARALSLSKYEQEFILNNYKTMTLKDINVTLGFNNYSRVVKNYLKSKNIMSTNFRNLKKLTDEQKEFILNNFNKMSMASIAKKLNIPKGRVRKYCIEINLYVPNIDKGDK